MESIVEQRGTCRTPLALNLQRKNKDDIARKNCCEGTISSDNRNCQRMRDDYKLRHQEDAGLLNGQRGLTHGKVRPI